MGIKDLFSKDKNTSIVSLTNKEDLSKDIESPEYYSSQIQEKRRFEPLVDYSFPENFAKFGSANKYYTDAITGIYTTYPFDGSQNDRIQWSLTASGIDRYIFENEYPRTNGYVNMGYSYGASNGGAADGYGTFGSDEYIFIKGGPNAAPNGGALSSIFANSSSNFYDTSKNRDSNLELDGDTGVCVEFWLKKDGFTSQSSKQTIFDLWNSASFGTDGYGRFRVETRSTDTTKMYLEIMS